jgi:hypothetical protein
MRRATCLVGGAMLTFAAACGGGGGGGHSGSSSTTSTVPVTASAPGSGTGATTTSIIVSGPFCDDAVSFEFIGPSEITALIGNPGAQRDLLDSAHKTLADAPPQIHDDVATLVTLDEQVVSAVVASHGDAQQLARTLTPTLNGEAAKVTAAAQRVQQFFERQCGVSPLTPGTTAPPRGTLPNS